MGAATHQPVPLERVREDATVWIAQPHVVLLAGPSDQTVGCRNRGHCCRGDARWQRETADGPLTAQSRGNNEGNAPTVHTHTHTQRWTIFLPTGKWELHIPCRCRGPPYHLFVSHTLIVLSYEPVTNIPVSTGYQQTQDTRKVWPSAWPLPLLPPAARRLISIRGFSSAPCTSVGRPAADAWEQARQHVSVCDAL